MPDFVRVKDKSTGDEYSARRPDLNKVEVLDEPAVDRNGRPLTGKPKAVADKPAENRNSRSRTHTKPKTTAVVRAAAETKPTTGVEPAVTPSQGAQNDR